MFVLTLLVPLIAGASAKPVATSLRRSNTQLVSRASHLDSCTKATNCEVYTDDSGFHRIRFIEGMGPGSDSYESYHALSKRDDVHTDVTIGDHKLAWGCDIDPVAELGHLDQACKETGSCDNTDPYNEDVQFLDVISGVYAGPVSQPLSIKASGHYPTWMRNGLVDAVKGAAGGDGIIQWHRGVQWHSNENKKRETPIIAGGGGKSGTCDIAVLSSYISVNIYNGDQLQGFIEADITVGSQDDPGFCGDIGSLDLIAAVTSGFGAVGAGAAAIVGTVKAACSA